MSAPVQAGGLARLSGAGVPVEVDRLEKSFGRLHVLRGVSLSFQPGRVTALIGPNAAGKSTLLKCILGLVRPDAGRITVGADIAGKGDAYRRRIGYMAQAPSFPEHLTAREVTRMLKDLRGPAAAVDDQLYASFGLAASLDKPLGTLSGGTRQKLNAALAFLFRPDVVILDEATAGLDPVAAGQLKEKVTAARDAGATVIITSHVIAELAELADDVALLLDGELRYQGALSQVIRDTGEPRLERAIASLMLRQEVRP
jgi:Cu-processing system ATP-binding protein